jgi:hypothetical protein
MHEAVAAAGQAPTRENQRGEGKAEIPEIPENTTLVLMTDFPGFPEFPPHL